ncbi:MAG: hypothetical protein R3F13_03000 [Prosthecobacter sp.]
MSRRASGSLGILLLAEGLGAANATLTITADNNRADGCRRFGSGSAARMMPLQRLYSSTGRGMNGGVYATVDLLPARRTTAAARAPTEPKLWPSERGSTTSTNHDFLNLTGTDPTSSVRVRHAW